MSNIFKDIENDVKKVEEDLLGPTYQYYKYISTPVEIGMSDDPNLGALVNDVSGLINYVQLLVSGDGPGSTTGKPLGNQFFLKTGAKCKDIKTGNIETRYLYVNNIPTGRIPFISSGLGVNFSMFKGLVPAILEDLDEINPFEIFQGFTMGSTPDCQALTMETTPSSQNNNQTRQTEFVANADIKNMEPCLFTLNRGVNPITKKRCREAFTNYRNTISHSKPHDFIYNLYLGIICLFAIYIIYQVFKKV